MSVLDPWKKKKKKTVLQCDVELFWREAKCASSKSKAGAANEITCGRGQLRKKKKKKKRLNQPRMRKPRWSNTERPQVACAMRLFFLSFKGIPRTEAKLFFSFFPFLHKGRFNNRKIQIKKALQNGRAFLCYLQSGDSFGARARSSESALRGHSRLAILLNRTWYQKKLPHHNASGAEARARNHLYSR